MIKSNRGVALATLVIAILVMVIITGTIAYTSLDTMKLRKLDDMYNDIRLLNQKVINYHIENDELPIREGITILKSELPDEIRNNNLNDSNDYYIIDLEKIGGVTLKYGKEYKNYSDDNKDVYIINEDSHTVYYLKGITIDSITKYTLEETYTQINLTTVTE